MKSRLTLASLQISILRASVAFFNLFDVRNPYLMRKNIYLAGMCHLKPLLSCKRATLFFVERPELSVRATQYYPARRYIAFRSRHRSPAAARRQGVAAKRGHGEDFMHVITPSRF